MSSGNSPSNSSRSSSGRRPSTSRSTKFLPNLSQLNNAVKELPDPETWFENTYTCPVEIEGKIHTIVFVTQTITRGSKKTRRWIYEGKLLIRKRDARISED